MYSMPAEIPNLICENKSANKKLNRANKDE